MKKIKNMLELIKKDKMTIDWAVTVIVSSDTIYDYDEDFIEFVDVVGEHNKAMKVSLLNWYGITIDKYEDASDWNFCHHYRYFVDYVINIVNNFNDVRKNLISLYNYLYFNDVDNMYKEKIENYVNNKDYLEFVKIQDNGRLMEIQIVLSNGIKTEKSNIDFSRIVFPINPNNTTFYLDFNIIANAVKNRDEKTIVDISDYLYKNYKDVSGCVTSILDNIIRNINILSENEKFTDNILVNRNFIVNDRVSNILLNSIHGIKQRHKSKSKDCYEKETISKSLDNMMDMKSDHDNLIKKVANLCAGILDPYESYAFRYFAVVNNIVLLEELYENNKEFINSDYFGDLVKLLISMDGDIQSQDRLLLIDMSHEIEYLKKISKYGDSDNINRKLIIKEVTTVVKSVINSLSVSDIFFNIVTNADNIIGYESDLIITNFLGGFLARHDNISIDFYTIKKIISSEKISDRMVNIILTMLNLPSIDRPHLKVIVSDSTEKLMSNTLDKYGKSLSNINRQMVSSGIPLNISKNPSSSNTPNNHNPKEYIKKIIKEYYDSLISKQYRGDSLLAKFLGCNLSCNGLYHYMISIINMIEYKEHFYVALLEYLKVNYPECYRLFESISIINEKADAHMTITPQDILVLYSYILEINQRIGFFDKDLPIYKLYCSIIEQYVDDKKDFDYIKIFDEVFDKITK